MPREPMRQRMIRMPDWLWDAAQKRADERGETVSETVRRLLEGDSGVTTSAEVTTMKVAVPFPYDEVEAETARQYAVSEWRSVAEKAGWTPSGNVTCNLLREGVLELGDGSIAYELGPEENLHAWEVEGTLTR